MTPNLTSARQAIQAELSHARQGVAFYSARVEALETALNQLESVEGDEAAPARKTRAKSANGRSAASSGRGRKPRAAKSDEAPAARGAAKGLARQQKGGQRAARTKGKEGRGGQDSGLPTTGTDFWLRLVTDEPRTAVEIANAAAQEIGIKPEQKEQIQKLKQRVAPALATLVSAQKVQDTGAGRERRFFKAAGAA